MRLFLIPSLARVMLLSSACGHGELHWRAVFSFAPQGTTSNVPTRPRWCADDTLWLTGTRVVRRDSDGWTQVDVCGPHATSSSGQARDIDLACLDNGRLVVLCGTRANEGQVLIEYDAAKAGKPVALPSDGTLVLAPMPDRVGLLGQTRFYMLEGGEVVDKGAHGLGDIRSAAGNASNDVVVIAQNPDDDAVYRFDGTTWSPIAEGDGRVELRRGAVFAITYRRDDEGYILRFRKGEPPFNLREAQPRTNRPIAAVAVLPPDRIVSLAFFRTGFERENPSAYLWLGRPGASDTDYLGAAPFIGGGGLYSAEGGGLVAVIDDDLFVGSTNEHLLEGVR